MTRIKYKELNKGKIRNHENEYNRIYKQINEILDEAPEKEKYINRIYEKHNYRFEKALPELKIFIEKQKKQSNLELIIEKSSPNNLNLSTMRILFNNDMKKYDHKLSYEIDYDLNSNYEVFLLKKDNSIIGYIITQVDEDENKVNLIENYVFTNLRNYGYGKKSVEFCINQYKNKKLNAKIYRKDKKAENILLEYGFRIIKNDNKFNYLTR